MLSLKETLSRVFGRPATPSRPRRQWPRRACLRLEDLESRTLLSGWAYNIGGTGTDAGRAVATDAAGNVYVTGSFAGTVDFDPGPGIVNLTSAGTLYDIFIAKYSPGGSLGWARRAGGPDSVTTDEGLAITLDAAGNVYASGLFSVSADFGATTLTSAGNQDIFVTKLDASGNFLWAKSAGGASFDAGFGVAVDTAGNVLVAGGFEGTADFDPGPASSPLTSAGLREIFVWKLDSGGNFLWAQRAGSATNDQARGGISLDSAGNSYVTGSFTGTADFGTVNLTSAGEADGFVAKLDPTGSFVWAVGIGGSGSDVSLGIARASDGSTYSTGSFSGTADFDPGPGVFNLTSGGAFVLKLDSAGAFVWAKRFGPIAASAAASAVGQGVVLDSSGNVYTVGYISANGSTSETFDFDPGAGIAPLTIPYGGSTTDAFISKLDNSGNFLAARKSSDDHAYGHGIAVDGSGAILTTGRFTSTGTPLIQTHFDIGTTTVPLTSTTNPNNTPNQATQDIFILKTTQEPPTTPQLTSLTDSPDPVARQGTLTLIASDVRVIAGGSNVASVSFYRDKNGNGTLQVGTDTLLGTDSNGSNGWSITTVIPSKFKLGTYTYFAQAKDASNMAGNVVSTTNKVRSGPVASMITSRDRAAASVDLVIDRYYSDDREDRDESASPSHLSGRSLVELLRTRSRR